MIFVTGDTHRLKDVDKFNSNNFPLQDRLSRDDYVIVAGDFGALWTGDERDREVLRFYDDKKFTTLFVAGNHENHPLINSYPVEEWNGGKIHRITENVIHLMNAQIFTINNRKIFIMGGATSVDKAYRTEGVSWWPEEEPAEEVFEEAVDNLKKYDNEVDYIITHTCPEFIRDEFVKDFNGFINYTSPVERFLEVVIDTVKYKKWYFGHIHVDRKIEQFNMRVLFNDVERLL